MTGKQIRTVVDCFMKCWIYGNPISFREFCSIIKIDEFDKDVAWLNLYYRRHEFPFYVSRSPNGN